MNTISKWIQEHTMQQQFINRFGAAIVASLRYVGPLIIIIVGSWQAQSIAIVNQVTLQMRDSSRVGAATIYIRDVASITGQISDSLKLRLENLELGPAAPPGYSRYVLKEEILRLANTFNAGNKTEYTLSGKKRIRVLTDGKEMRIGDFEPQIAQYLQDKLQWEKDTYSLTIENKEMRWFVYNKPFSCTITGDIDPYARGRVQLRLQINQEVSTRKMDVSCRLEVTLPVVCVKERIAKDELITAGKLELKLLNITGLRYMPYMVLDSVIGKKSARTLSASTTLYDKCVKNLPDILKGEMIFLEYKRDSIIITIPARAFEDGVVGEKIRVENTITKKLLEATVLKKGLATL